MRLVLASIALLVAACRTESMPIAQPGAEPALPAIASVVRPAIEVRFVEGLSGEPWIDDSVGHVVGERVASACEVVDEQTLKAYVMHASGQDRTRIDFELHVDASHRLGCTAQGQWWRSHGVVRTTNGVYRGPATGALRDLRGTLRVELTRDAVRCAFELDGTTSEGERQVSGAFTLPRERTLGFYDRCVDARAASRNEAAPTRDSR